MCKRDFSIPGKSLYDDFWCLDKSKRWLVKRREREFFRKCCDVSINDWFKLIRKSRLFFLLKKPSDYLVRKRWEMCVVVFSFLFNFLKRVIFTTFELFNVFFSFSLSLDARYGFSLYWFEKRSRPRGKAAAVCRRTLFFLFLFFFHIVA